MQKRDYIYWPSASLKLFLTNKCNNRCVGCYVPPGVSNLSAGKTLGVIEEARDTFGTYLVEFLGGEPTVRFNLLILAIIKAKSLGMKTKIVTNGGILGASGEYKELIYPFLEKENIHDKTTFQKAKILIDAGLDNITLSFDSMHNISDKDFRLRHRSDKVPVSIAANVLSAFLHWGYGKKRDLNKYNQLDYHGLRVNITASGDQYEESMSMLSEMMKLLGAKESRKEGRFRVYSVDGQEIFVRRKNLGDIGPAAKLNNSSFNPLGERIYTIGCPHFKPRCEAIDNGKYHQDIAVDFNGEVYTCNMLAFPIGNVKKMTLKEIADRVNSGLPCRPASPELQRGEQAGRIPKKYQTSIKAFRYLLQIASEGYNDNALGEAIRRIVEVDPKLIRELRSHVGACYAFGHDPKLLEALKRKTPHLVDAGL